MKINVTNLGFEQITEVINSITGTVIGFSQMGELVFLEVDKTRNSACGIACFSFP